MALNQKGSFGFDMEEKFRKVSSAQIKEEYPQTDTDTHTDADMTRIVTAPIKENKTRKLWLLTKPSTHQILNEYAKANGNTFNNLINTLMEEFIQEKGL